MLVQKVAQRPPRGLQGCARQCDLLGWWEMEGGAAQEGLPARAAGCPSAHPCVPQDGALAPKPPLALPHLLWTKPRSRSPAQVCDWTWRTRWRHSASWAQGICLSS